MRLLYWYTRFLNSKGSDRKYRGLTHFEINLSTTERFHFDSGDSQFISASLEPPLPSGFWGGNIYNLHVLTGNNGAGKSTIMNYIMDTFHELYRRELKSLDETVFVLEIEGESFLVYLPGYSKSREKLFAPMEQYYFMPGELPAHHRILDAIDRTKLIYLTNTLSEADDRRVREYDFHDHIRYHFIYDCSTSGVMRFNEKDDCYANQTGDLLRLYFTNEQYKQVKFVCDREQYRHLRELQKNGKPVPVPKTLHLTIRESSSFTSELTDVMGRIQAQCSLSEQIALRLCIACLSTYISNLRKWQIPHSEFNLEELRALEYDEFERMFRKVLHCPEQEDNNKISKRLCERSLDFIRFVCEQKDCLLEHFSPEFDRTNLHSGKALALVLPLTEQNKRWLIRFMHLYRQTCSPYYFLDFSWGLSSGENNLLRLFSSLFYIFYYSGYPICNAREDGREDLACDTVLLFMDEADLTYHPEWQRQFVSVLTAFLPKVYGNCGVKDVQVFLSTHSPLLLGDIPKNNVSYLTSGTENANDEEIETFGQNIHQILKNSFFLSNGTVGAFAEEKINNTAARLRRIAKLLKEKEEPLDLEGIEDFFSVKREMEECRQVIDLVAPGILKSKLMDLYREASSALSKASGEEEEIPVYKQAQQMSREQLEVLIRIYQSELERRERDD